MEILKTDWFMVVTNLHDNNTGDPSIVLATPYMFNDIRLAQGYVDTIHPACEPRIIRGDFKNLKFYGESP